MRKFNVAILDSNVSPNLEEFIDDNLIILNNETIKEMIGDAISNIDMRLENTCLYLKYFLIRNYKNLIFINANNVDIKPGLRKEIEKLVKTKDKLFMFNAQDISNSDIFFSKKCPKYIREIFDDYKYINDISFLKRSFLFKKEINNYNFDNITYYPGLFSLGEILSETDKVQIVDFADKSKKDIFSFLEEKDRFYIFINVKEYFSSFDFETEFHFYGVPNRRRIIYTYNNMHSDVIETDGSHRECLLTDIIFKEEK